MCLCCMQFSLVFGVVENSPRDLGSGSAICVFNLGLGSSYALDFRCQVSNRFRLEFGNI